MKVIVAGTRSIDLIDHTIAAIEASEFIDKVTEFVSGTARGPDSHIIEIAHDWGIPVKLFPAQWRDQNGTYNPRAGYERNTRMAEYADALIAVWDGKSRGTKHMISQAQQHGLKLYVHTVPSE